MAHCLQSRGCFDLIWRKVSRCMIRRQVDSDLGSQRTACNTGRFANKGGKEFRVPVTAADRYLLWLVDHMMEALEIGELKK